MTISSYGLLVGFGFLAAYGASVYLARRIHAEEHVHSVLLWAFVPAVICARGLFVLYHLDYFIAQPGEIIAVWHGGWVWHGALFGGLAGIVLYSRKARVSLLSFLDVLAPGVALGQAIGRWGNYFNQEAYGFPTNVPWALTIDPLRRLPGYEAFATYHPTFLYESAVDAALFLVLGGLILKRLDPRFRGDDPPSPGGYGAAGRSGMVFFIYLLLYSLARFWIEFLRIDIVPVLAGLRAPQWISLGLIVVSIVGLARVLRKQKKMVY